MWRGARESAGEIGHIVMQIGGPKCGCGNRGCLEALASRTAIERHIREALAAGRTSVLTELTGGDLSVIRSGSLRRAIQADDALVCDILRRAAEVLGYACLTVRHLIDPEVIVLGGGVVEACSDFLMPIVENIVGNDRLPGARDGGQVRLSALGDDAVVLGAVALARKRVGRSPFKKRFHVAPRYPEIVSAAGGEITVATADPSPRHLHSRQRQSAEEAEIVRQAAARPAAPHPPQGTAEDLPRRPGNPFHRRRPGRESRSERRSPAVLEPPGDSPRGLAHHAGRGGLQSREATESGLDARDVLTRHVQVAHSRPYYPSWRGVYGVAVDGRRPCRLRMLMIN